MSYLENPDVYKAGLVIIGNEILSGRTEDKNTNWIAEKVITHGITLVEVRIITDREEKIIQAVNSMREEVDYVFTTGGIGPTHDDITAESVAKAFGLELERNEEAYQMLIDHYGSKDKVEGIREKMAMIPKGAELIHNTVSGAPGFIVDNVHVMAGVPRIMHNMFEYLLANHLTKGKQVFSNNVLCSIAESRVANKLEVLQKDHPAVEIGSYPNFREGSPAVSLVLRSTEEEPLKLATKALLQLIDELGEVPDAMSFQVMPD